jgi:hypothetical protein
MVECTVCRQEIQDHEKRIVTVTVRKQELGFCHSRCVTKPHPDHHRIDVDEEESVK